MVVVVIAPKASVFIVCAKVSQNALGCQSEFSRAQIGQVADQKPGFSEKPGFSWHGDQALNMLLEKRQHPLPGVLRRVRIVAGPLVVEERVLRARIDLYVPDSYQSAFPSSCQ